MKFLLILSLCLNGVLFYRLNKKTPTIQKQRTRIVEVKAPVVESPVVQDKVSVNSAKSIEASGLAAHRDLVPLNEHDYQEINEKISADRKDYLEGIGVSEKAIKKSDRAVEKYGRETAMIYKKMKNGMTLEERRKLLDLEAELNKDLRDIYGEERFEKYQKFKNSYNDRLLNCEDGECMGPIVLMGP